MNQQDDMGRKLLYHARMFALSVFCAVVLVVVGIGVLYLLLHLGILHLEMDR